MLITCNRYAKNFSPAKLTNQEKVTAQSIKNRSNSTIKHKTTPQMQENNKYQLHTNMSNTSRTSSLLQYTANKQIINHQIIDYQHETPKLIINLESNTRGKDECK